MMKEGNLVFFAFQYDIVGHSGEDYKVHLTSFEKPPKNNKERLQIAKVTINGLTVWAMPHDKILCIYKRVSNQLTLYQTTKF